MSAGWVVYVLVVGTLLAVGGSALSRALRYFGHSTRFAYAAALAGLLVLAVLAPRAATIELRAPTTHSVVTSTGPNHAQKPRLRDRIVEARDALGNAAAQASHLAERSIPPAAMRIAAIVWLAASATLLLTIALVNRRLVLARRAWPTRELCGTTVRIAPDVGPAVLGFTRAEVVVPSWLLELPEEKQRLVLEHEREHLRARDHLLLGGAWFAVAVAPWHPGVWYLANRIRLAIELDCDARVLRRGASPRSYGTLLIDMATRQSAAHVGALALADGGGPSHLERRILAMQSKSGRRAMARGVLLTAVGGVMVLVACEARMPTSAEIASMDVAGAQRSAAKAGLLRTPEDDRADFFVNGARVSSAQARALEARQIGSIEVVKSERAEGRDTIYVTTLDRMPTEFRQSKVPDPFEAVEAAGKQRTMRDSTEHLVAHVERELAASRLRESSAAPSANPAQSKLRVSQGGPEPIMILDGRKATMAEIAAIPESQIRSVQVLKKDGTGIDPDAANGIIAVETRGYRKP